MSKIEPVLTQAEIVELLDVVDYFNFPKDLILVTEKLVVSKLAAKDVQGVEPLPVGFHIDKHCSKEWDMPVIMTTQESLTEALSAAREEGRREVDESHKATMTFYSVDTYHELVDVMRKHIVRLQAKIPPLPDEGRFGPARKA